MTFDVKLYNTTDDFRRAVKNITVESPLETITVNTSDNCSIIRPELLVNLASTVQDLNRINFNYAIIEKFNNRRYFVTPEYATATRMLLHCVLDPYSSFDLSDVEGFIKRTEKAPGRVKDESIPIIYDAVLVQTYAFKKSPYKWSAVNPENNGKDNIYILRTR